MTSLFKVPDEPGAKGALRVARCGEELEATSRLRFRSKFVNGGEYGGMEDNDLRGFLDGDFYWGWNQPGQSHVRVGRVGYGPNSSAPPGRAPVYGEHELFRVIQRWDRLSLPEGAKITDCQLTLAVEEGSGQPLRLMLYEVKKDWDPGTGGVHNNNVSIPSAGEVWWNDVGFGKAAWGLPGAGFASREHPEADTGVTPLAEWAHQPGDSSVKFASTALTEYVAARVEAQRPLLFLLKLADLQEDVPGSIMVLYSGNYGDSRNVERRPRLVIEWEIPSGVTLLAEDVHLEYGRSVTFPRVPSKRGSMAGISFDSDAGYAEPVIEVREGKGDNASAWFQASDTLQAHGDWIQVRITAVSDSVSLGAPFMAGLRDTWVTTGAPSDQQLRFVFSSPTGITHEVNADYLGDFAWGLRFMPNELGPWQYCWSHRFTTERKESSLGRFDVIGGHPENIRAQLENLAVEIEEVRRTRGTARLDEHRIRFSRLQRAALQLVDPESYRSPGGEQLRRHFKVVRSLLWGRAVPDRIPMKSLPLRWEIDGTPLTEPIPLDQPAGPRGAVRRMKRSLRRLKKLRNWRSVPGRLFESMAR